MFFPETPAARAIHAEVNDRPDHQRPRRLGTTSLLHPCSSAPSEANIIAALYEASQAGVKIDLVVRGICCLRPGVPGVSENITVRSVLGRFLEHARVYNFCAGGEDLVFTSSADWMDRNLNRRVEVAAPIMSRPLKARVIREALDLALKDNTNAWILDGDGDYTLQSGSSHPFFLDPRSSITKTGHGDACSPRGASRPLLGRLG